MNIHPTSQLDADVQHDDYLKRGCIHARPFARQAGTCRIKHHYTDSLALCKKIFSKKCIPLICRDAHAHFEPLPARFLPPGTPPRSPAPCPDDCGGSRGADVRCCREWCCGCVAASARCLHKCRPTRDALHSIPKRGGLSKAGCQCPAMPPSARRSRSALTPGQKADFCPPMFLRGGIGLDFFRLYADTFQGEILWDHLGALFRNGSTMAEEEGYIRGIEDAVGLNVEEIRHTPLDELRKRFEARDGGRRMRFLSEFPFVGRGSVLGDRLVPHEEAERAFASAVAKLRG